MKRFNFAWRASLFVLTCLFAIGCSSDEAQADENKSDTPFSVTLDGKEYCGTTQRILTPFSEMTYELNIKAAPNITWQVTADGLIPSDFLEVNPSNGQGEGVVKITIKKNENKEKGCMGTVSIANNGNNAVTKFLFDQKEKELLFPQGLTSQTKEEYYQKNSQYNIYHMAEGPNVAILYDSRWGDNPETDPKLPLDRKKAVEYAEDIYTWLIDVAGFANWTTSKAAQYKIVVFVRYENSTAGSSWGASDVAAASVGQAGIMKINKHGVPGVLQHEMTHCFQYIAQRDGAQGFTGSSAIYEMTAQWSLCQRWADWPDLEYSHFKPFMQNTHKAFLHEDNAYHAPYVLIYWEYKHPLMVSRVWKENEKGVTDPVETYKHLANLTQEEFNDDMFECVSRFVTWDIPHLKEANAKHIDKHQYKLKEISASKFQAHPETCPQNYGYNCIKLKAPAAGKVVTIDFKGNINLNGYKIKNGPYKGWRYGFVALKENGERIYGEMNKEDSKRITFTVPEGGVKYLWFVVMGAPTTHWKHLKPSDNGGVTDNNDWPYEFTLNGTELDTPMSL